MVMAAQIKNGMVENRDDSRVVFHAKTSFLILNNSKES